MSLALTGLGAWSAADRAPGPVATFACVTVGFAFIAVVNAASTTELTNETFQRVERRP